MRFRIGDGRIYDVAGIDRLTLANILKLEKETVELGRPMKWSDLRTMTERIEGLTPEEFEADDDTPWVLALTVWASRLSAGEHITFEEAISFPMADLQMLPEPQDHQPDPQSARPGSGRAGSNAAPAKTGKKTSAKASSPA